MCILVLVSNSLTVVVETTSGKKLCHIVTVNIKYVQKAKRKFLIIKKMMPLNVIEVGKLMVF